MTGTPSPSPIPPGRKAGPSPPKKHKTTFDDTNDGNKNLKGGQRGSLPPPPPPRGPPKALPRPWPTPFAATKERTVVHRQHQKTPLHSNTTNKNKDKTNPNSKKRPKLPTPPPSPIDLTGNHRVAKSNNRVSNAGTGNKLKPGHLKNAKGESVAEDKNRTMVMLKLRFTPDLEYKHYGASTMRKHTDPVIMHLRKFMQRCIDVTNRDIVFKTFTSEKEFDYGTGLKNDKEAAEELLAHQVEKQRHSHEMLIKLELGIPIQQFKNGMYPWMKANSTFMIEHPYAKKQIETTRIGFIRSKHPTDTFRLDYQNELNANLSREFEDKDDEEVKDILMQETGDDSDFPTIRIITQFISWDTGDIRLETRGLVLECLKSDKKFILGRVESLFPTDSPYRFIPFSMPYDRNLPKASEIYATIIRHHMTDLESQFTFPIIGISEDNMHRETSSGMSMKEMLEQDPSILSVEKTPGTKGIGKWNIITTRDERKEAEQHFDETLKMASATMDMEDKIGKAPFRVDLSPIPDDYMNNVINSSMKGKSHTGGSTMSSITSDETMNSIESRFENIANKCENTIEKCGTTVKKIEEDQKTHWLSIQQEFKDERNEFKAFLQKFQQENNEKFTELFEFKKDQEIENTQVQLEMATLRSEISHIRRQMKNDKGHNEARFKHLQGELADIKQDETIDFIAASEEHERNSQKGTDFLEKSDEQSRSSSDSRNSQMSFQYSNDEDAPRMPEPNESSNKEDPMLQPAPDPANFNQQE